jgi:hypothetical protein
MRLFLYQLKKRTQAFIATASDVLIFTGLVLIGGIGTSWYMVKAGTGLTTRTVGPWVSWRNEGRRDADPYTRAHFAQTGRLNLTTEIAGTYIATTDDEGIRLHSSCEYLVTGENIDAGWWSISAFTHDGYLIPNPSNRHAFTSETAALKADGTFDITLARDARPGNWLPTGGAGRLAIMLQTIEPASAIDEEGEIEDITTLPEIRKVRCR